MIAQPKIAVLLSTFNGGRFLGDQLDSILSQNYSNFVIVVRDDGSSDDTLDILSSYMAQQPDKFHLETADKANRGARGSFSYLIEYVLANREQLGLEPAYMMFCDQDDIWYDSKMQTQVSAMLAAESGDNSVPVLIHSDLQVVSENHEIIAESLIRFQGLEIERNRFINLVISNLVTGCTVLINQSLAEKSVPVPDRAIMHDWWLAMVATAFGKLVLLDSPLVHYRQHEANTIGAKQYVKPGRTSRSFWQRLIGLQPNEHLFEVALQADEFRQRFGRQLGSSERLGLRIAAAMRIRIGIVQRLLFRAARGF